MGMAPDSDKKITAQDILHFNTIQKQTLSKHEEFLTILHDWHEEKVIEI